MPNSRLSTGSGSDRSTESRIYSPRFTVPDELIENATISVPYPKYSRLGGLFNGTRCFTEFRPVSDFLKAGPIAYRRRSSAYNLISSAFKSCRRRSSFALTSLTDGRSFVTFTLLIFFGAGIPINRAASERNSGRHSKKPHASYSSMLFSAFDNFCASVISGRPLIPERC